jgi:ferrous iron transport protein A
MALTKLKIGIHGIIVKINSDKGLFMRLASMGLIEGSRVSILSNSGKGPLILESDGKKFAIGRQMASSIFIQV